jgi:hypothetical protein
MPRKTAQPEPDAPAEVAPARSRPFGFARFTLFGRLAADAEGTTLQHPSSREDSNSAFYAPDWPVSTY